MRRGDNSKRTSESFARPSLSSKKVYARSFRASHNGESMPILSETLVIESLCPFLLNLSLSVERVYALENKLEGALHLVKVYVPSCFSFQFTRNSTFTPTRSTYGPTHFLHSHTHTCVCKITKPNLHACWNLLVRTKMELIGNSNGLEMTHKCLHIWSNFRPSSRHTLDMNRVRINMLIKPL